MPPTKTELIVSIISASTFLLMVVVAAFLLFRIYLRKKNSLLLEQEKLKLDYEKILFTSKFEVQEQIFTQISREIHDNIGQILSLVRLNINTLNLPDDRLAATDELLERAITDLRHLSHNLNTRHILETGFTAAIQKLVNHLSNTRQFITSFEGEAVDTSMPEEKAIILFRIVQEVINNIINHARARTIDVRISESTEGFIVQIKDDGVGFDTGLNAEGLGIRNMRERAGMIGATIDFESKIGNYTTVTIHIKNDKQV